ncbi:cupin domain-containing protein [Paraglaciecola sp.]|uniref:cupin domain-containing protein n=1 Tax=Paraglaciecola sp. TaxID=1920173 RepID=UPI0030F39F2A
MSHSPLFIFGQTHGKEELGNGISRQIMGYNHELMLVRVWFDDNAIGYVHKHFHSQITYVESGEFAVQIGDEIKLLKAGDCFYIPPDIEHGAVCKKAGILLDTFSPARQDFLQK